MNKESENTPPYAPYSEAFAFWGARNYVQGTTMLEGLVKAVGSWNIGQPVLIKGNFRRMLNTQGTYYVIPTAAQSDIKELPAFFQVDTSAGRYVIGLQGNQQEITERMDYNENEAIKKSFITEAEQSITLVLEHTKIHELLKLATVLNKRLFDTLHGIRANEKYYIARFDLEWLKLSSLPEPLHNVKLQVILVSIFQTTVKAHIELDGTKIGVLYSVPVIK